jgi:gluconolactonase
MAHHDPSRWESSAPIRYPDPDIIVLDPRFRHLVVRWPPIERIATGFRFTEGRPTTATGATCCSPTSQERTAALGRDHRASRTLRNPAGHPDGSTRDRQGRLVTCELGSRTLTRTEHDGTVTVLASSFEARGSPGTERRGS